MVKNGLFIKIVMVLKNGNFIKKLKKVVEENMVEIIV